MKHAFLVIIVVVLAYGTYVVMNQGLRADELQTEGRGQLKVLVTDEVGIPLSNAAVKVSSQEGGPTYNLTLRSDDGFYSGQVEPGAYTLEARALGYAADTQHIEIRRNQTQEVTFSLTKE